MKLNKKWVIGISIGVVLITALIILIVIFVNKKEKENNKKVVENTYTAYVSINPIIKLTFSENCEGNVCYGNPKMLGYELVNDDAKVMLKDLDISGMQLHEVLILLRDIVSENGVVVDTVNVYSDWKSIDDYVTENIDATHVSVFNVHIKHKYELEDLTSLLTSDKVQYTVSFNSDGGSSVENQVVEEGSKVAKPSNPTKKNSVFEEWRLDGKTYDFNSPVTKNIELKAIWKSDGNTEEPVIQEKVLGSYPLPKRSDTCTIEKMDDGLGNEIEVTHSEWAFLNIENLINSWTNYYGYFYTDTKHIYIAEQISLEFDEYGRVYWTDERCSPLAASPIYGSSNLYIQNYRKTYKVGNPGDIGALLPQFGYKVKCTKDKCWNY